MIRIAFATLTTAMLLAGCAGSPPPATEAALPSGISHTGSVGMTGGPAAAPAGVGNVTTTTVR